MFTAAHKMFARAQCQPFVLAWHSLIYFLWGWSLIFCSSKNPISKSERHPEVRFKRWDKILCMILLLVLHPIPRNTSSWGQILTVSVFLINLEQEVNLGGTNVLIIWGRTMAIFHFSASLTDTRMRFRSLFNAMWQQQQQNLFSTYCIPSECAGPEGAIKGFIFIRI